MKHTLRLFRRTPALSAVAFLCLAMAIGLTTAAFSVIHGAFFSPLPLPDGERVVTVRDYLRSGQYDVPATPATLTMRRERSRSFDALGGWYTRKVSVGSSVSDASGALVRAAYISPDGLELLGIAPRLGRHATAVDVLGSPVVMLGYDVWRTRFGSDDRILDRTVHIGGAPHRVIGVMPQGFRFPLREDVWVPIQTDAHAAHATTETLTMFGRLKAGVSASQAAAELATLPVVDPPRDATQATVPLVRPFTRGFMTPDEDWSLYGFIGGLLLFLVVIAANLANLFLARNSARTREVALRAALGASRGRLIAQLLGESLLLGSAAALAGLAVARGTIVWFSSLLEDVPWWSDFGMSSAVIGFVVFATLLSSAVAGVGPALRLTRASVSESLKDGNAVAGGLRFSRVGGALIVAQIAISVGFLSVVGALAQGLFGFSYQRYQMPAEDVLVSQVYLGPPPAAELSAPGADRREVWQRHFARSGEQFERIRAELRREPGVRHVTYASLFPGNDVETTRIEIEAGAVTAAESTTTRIAEVGPEFFDVLNAGIVSGRDFLPEERTGPGRSAIVNVPFAEKYFPGRTPLGRKLRIVTEDGRPGPWLDIVGVVPDLALNPGDAGRADGIYVPFSASSFARLAVLGSDTPERLIPRLYDHVTRENPNAQIQSAESLASQMRTAETVFRGLGTGLSLVGGTALLLSAVSLYSLVSFGVTRRTREIGIRLALGASRRRIVTTVLRRELIVTLVGAAAGAVLGAGLYQLVALMPFDLSPAGPSLLVAVIGLMFLVGVGACVFPARRAVRIEPAAALRQG